ncbi:unnamed protein product [Bursaphelenchus xylophilus]|uniref:(pine wood nematode) hypothetical protein n=1 Tax=Bursaphelenchus xylophilus TaxID=6326 RepID=A0A1I7RLM4_BURXY|nr:unnamed protein product [Bursaphelenchus xylophilus]CAG9082821.1 unnamed protein product [Bursaphelenchus xylophilus]
MTTLLSTVKHEVLHVPQTSAPQRAFTVPKAKSLDARQKGQLIDLIHYHQELWNSSNPNFRNKAKMAEAWTHIAAVMNDPNHEYTIDFLKQAYKHLRDTFHRYCRLEQQGLQTEIREKWPYNEKFRFLSEEEKKVASLGHQRRHTDAIRPKLPKARSPAIQRKSSNPEMSAASESTADRKRKLSDPLEIGQRKKPQVIVSPKVQESVIQPNLPSTSSPVSDNSMHFCPQNTFEDTGSIMKTLYDTLGKAVSQTGEALHRHDSLRWQSFYMEIQSVIARYINIPHSSLQQVYPSYITDPGMSFKVIRNDICMPYPIVDYVDVESVDEK